MSIQHAQNSPSAFWSPKPPSNLALKRTEPAHLMEVIPPRVNTKTAVVPGLVNIEKAIENGPSIVDLPIQVVIFHGYASLPDCK